MMIDSGTNISLPSTTNKFLKKKKLPFPPKVETFFPLFKMPTYNIADLLKRDKLWLVKDFNQLICKCERKI